MKDDKLAFRNTSPANPLRLTTVMVDDVELEGETFIDVGLAEIVKSGIDRMLPKRAICRVSGARPPARFGFVTVAQ